uniref:Macrolide export ATP-binding/permease protein MacB n=2 Tax=Brucella abortus TaxID=235 RepID=MACB_BRUA2|nr:RecName: Full=Macrolide export ATP-binding/permease protein MacB [Brucella abortus 2308]
MAGAPLIRLEDICKTFHNGDLAVEVLHGITLDIRAGEFVAIMGASGSGKSTLMNILGCLDTPTGGRYLLDGEDVSTLNADELATLRRRTFGFVFQSYNLIPTSTAQENVEVPAIYAGTPAAERRKRAAALLNALKLGDRLDHRPSQLSGGQQQRISIARALMNGGRIILADEPTGALDSQSGEDVMELLRSMHQQGHTVIVITHAREVAERADRLIEIRDGQILSDTTKRDIHTPEATLQPHEEIAGNGAHIADISEAVKMALHALRANIFRTVLTLLGIIIGVSSVVTMLAIGTGAQNTILDRINAMGTDLILVRPAMAGFRGSGSIATLVPQDADAILELPNVKSAVPEVTGTVTLRRGNVDYQSQANGTVPAFSSEIVESRQRQLHHPERYRYLRPCGWLGTTVVKTLFPDGGNPVGDYILIQKIPFQIIGTLEPKGAGFGGSDQDDVVVVPLSTGNLRLFGQKYVRSITVQVKDSSLIDTTQNQIQSLLDQRHKKRDTMITNMSSVREDAAAMGKTMTVFLGSVAAISLLVGGIGVMNIMLVSVTERTREIGVRMATGARRRDILLQFIIEALSVSAIGGAIGVILGLGAAALASWAGLSVGYSFGPVLLAFACAFATGLIFGFLPARKASRLLPAVALSSE